MSSASASISRARCAAGGVGGEVRHAHTGAEDDHAALLQVAHGAQRDVGLGDLAHGDGGLHPAVDALLLQEVLEGEAVHHGAEHAHVVRAGAVHAALLEFGTAEEVSAADDNRDLGAVPDDGGDLTGDLVHHVGVHTQAPATGERLSGQLQQKPAAYFAVVALLGLGGHGDPASFTCCTYEEGHCRWELVRIPCAAMASSSDLLSSATRVRGGVPDDC
ncbi:hypothetical protein RKD46_002617 [Streptomyces pseudovenezuelae]